MSNVEIDGKEYNSAVIDKFCEMNEIPVSILTNPIEGQYGWYKEILISHLMSFEQGFAFGYESGVSDAPDCDNCDIQQKYVDEGPPESHHSQQDR